MPALLEEDGAKFCARIVAVGADGFRASCWAEIVNGSPADVEMPDHHVAQLEEAARQWVREVAARRGFSKISWRR